VPLNWELVAIRIGLLGVEQYYGMSDGQIQVKLRVELELEI
jgi:hypothetical protein